VSGRPSPASRLRCSVHFIPCTQIYLRMVKARPRGHACPCGCKAPFAQMQTLHSCRRKPSIHADANPPYTRIQTLRLHGRKPSFRATECVCTDGEFVSVRTGLCVRAKNLLCGRFILVVFTHGRYNASKSRTLQGPKSVSKSTYAFGHPRPSA
jgi:hypothetical protein